MHREIILCTLLFLVCVWSCKKDNNDNQEIKETTWHEIKIEGTRLSDISILDARGFIYGCSLDTSSNTYKSRLYETTNCGDDWSEVIINTQIADGFRMCFVTDNIGFLINSIILLRTTDGGINWEEVGGFDNLHRFSKICKINNSTILGYYGTGDAYISYDLGESWESYSNKLSINPEEVSFINEQIGYAIGGYKVYKTINGGNDWIFVSQFFNYCECRDLHFIDENNGVALTYKYNGPYSPPEYCIRQTKDGGLTWVTQDYIGVHELYSVFYEDIKTIYIGTNCGIKISYNGGISWEDDYVSNTPILSIDKISNKMVAVGNNLLLMKY